ncbi:MAG: DNRLRE domain-containing protein [Anaerolineae bacterium]|jgi:uncharacterized repeat protein (TIGR01451 family)|nr:DNRLRE domain-containing protein [Anaerolineae bacterium]MDH7473289.1 DNRLRE domain-containing protein [Anaerolineae bacterium]
MGESRLNLGFQLLMCFVLFMLIPGMAAQASAISPGPTLSPKPRYVSSTSSVSRPTINVHPVAPTSTSERPAWQEAAMLWFGHQSTDQDNYIDVRVAYDDDELLIRFTVIDLFLWYPVAAQLPADLTQWDTVDVLLDTTGDGAAMPQLDDYRFQVAMRLDYVPYQTSYWNDARGNGSGWNISWTPGTAWHNETWPSWYFDPGVNQNNGYDAGWTAIIRIPFASLGLSGAPIAGTTWGLGLICYDRDNVSGSPPVLAPKVWPGSAAVDAPSTWGHMVFNPPSYKPPATVAQGTTIIIASRDAYVQGGRDGSGSSNHSDENYGGAHELFVQAESTAAHFNHFQRTYLQFNLSSVPAGKVIISATLTLHQFGNDDCTTASPSLLHLFQLNDDWDEYSITWNNSPQAWQNLTSTWVQVLCPEDWPGWPGVPYHWDATQVVAEAYAAGKPVNIALYTSDTERDSGKYFVARHSTITDGHPRLTVTWGQQAATITKSVDQAIADPGEVLRYTINVIGSGQPLTMTDPIPQYLTYIVGSASGGATYNSGQKRIEWSGSPAAGEYVTLTFQAWISDSLNDPTAIVNEATLQTGEGSSTGRAVTIVNALSVYLPLVLKNY